jgi:hypothetical protein
MQPATASVRIMRPRAVVHELLADISRQAEFLDHLVVDWTVTSDEPRGVGASARLRWKDRDGPREIAIVVTEVTPERIVQESRGGRGMRRRMRLTHTIDAVSDAATQVTAALELLEGSIVDRVSWPLTRTHLERRYGQAMLRLKGILERDPAPR